MKWWIIGDYFARFVNQLLPLYILCIYNITANKHVTTQDTNDRYLANIRNGTYSVVPKLQEENYSWKIDGNRWSSQKIWFYTKKITGAQRIDLFGALNDLKYGEY
jgi:nitrite reductase (NADH) large subunit